MLNLVKKIDEEKYPDFPKALRNNLRLKVNLVSASDEGIVIDAKGVKVEVPYEQIKRANLETDINKIRNTKDAEVDSELETEDEFDGEDE